MELYKVNNFISKEDATTIMKFMDEKVGTSSMSAPRGRLVMKFGGEEDAENLLPTSPIDELGYVKELVIGYWEKITKLINDQYNLDEEIYPSTLWLSKQYSGSVVPEHRDNNEDRNARYSHTAISYLNDQAVGGKTYFPILNEVITPTQGNMVFFDCKDDDSLHGVTVARSPRYTMSLWFTKDPNYRFDIHS